jgi:hypothetical protein
LDFTIVTPVKTFLPLLTIAWDNMVLRMDTLEQLGNISLHKEISKYGKTVEIFKKQAQNVPLCDF